MRKGDRVTMIKFDGWAHPDWTGTVFTTYASRPSVTIKWDNGQHSSHQIKNLILIGAEDDPNVAFLMHKYNKEKKK